MYNDDGNFQAIWHSGIDEFHITLGAMLTPDDNNRIQVSRMRQITLKFSDIVYMWFICRHDVLHALNKSIIQSLNWPLPVILQQR